MSGTCQHWPLVGLPILNNCSSASFGFCNWLLAEIKMCLYCHRLLCPSYYIYVLLWGLDSRCHPLQIIPLVRARPSVFTVVDLSGNITQFYSDMSSRKILGHHLTQERGGVATWHSWNPVPNLTLVQKQLAHFRFNYSINWSDSWLTIIRTWAVPSVQKRFCFNYSTVCKPYAELEHNIKAWTFKCQLVAACS